MNDRECDPDWIDLTDIHHAALAEEIGCTFPPIEETEE